MIEERSTECWSDASKVREHRSSYRQLLSELTTNTFTTLEIVSSSLRRRRLHSCEKISSFWDGFVCMYKGEVLIVAREQHAVRLASMVLPLP